MGEVNLLNIAQEKIIYGEKLLESLKQFNHLEGIQKLQRKIKQELNFLKKIYKSGMIKKEHLQCSNLTHFDALIKVLSDVKDCRSVNKTFNYGDRKINVDIVCDKGLSWLKVIARNPKSIAQICLGDASFGVRSVLDQAEEFLQCAEFYPCLFQKPKVIFIFANGISKVLSLQLESMGVVVRGDRITNINDEFSYDYNSQSELTSKNVSHINKVNLDVSAMLAYVSSVTNGSCLKYKFSVPVLAQQADWECKRPVKPILEEYFKDKTLYCCETARDSFLDIVETVGGTNERQRGGEFLKRIIVLPDNATSQDTAIKNVDEVFNNVQYTSDKELLVGGKIRERSLVIFTFGDRIKAVTVTANDGFVRAAKQQGINFVVFVHESRALTEQKEMKATKVDPEQDI